MLLCDLFDVSARHAMPSLCKKKDAGILQCRIGKKKMVCFHTSLALKTIYPKLIRYILDLLVVSHCPYICKIVDGYRCNFLVSECFLMFRYDDNDAIIVLGTVSHTNIVLLSYTDLDGFFFPHPRSNQ